MSEPRLKAGLWASAALRRAHQLGRSGMVLRRGDPDAGGILVVLRDRAGQVSVLAHDELKHAQLEMTRKGKQAGVGAGMLGCMAQSGPCVIGRGVRRAGQQGDGKG